MVTFMLCIKNAQLKINELNCKLQKNFKLQFDYCDDLCTDMYLILYLNELNISSIKCTPKLKFMYISSRTHELHQNKKYNLFLRAIIFLITPHIKYNNKKILYLRSFAINEYSEKCLKKYFIVADVKNESYTFELNVNKNLKIANELFNKINDIIV